MGIHPDCNHQCDDGKHISDRVRRLLNTFRTITRKIKNTNKKYWHLSKWNRTHMNNPGKCADAIYKRIAPAYTFWSLHDDVIKWKHFPRNWPFVREIHRSPVNFPHKGQWRGVLMFSLIYAWINDWVNNREAGDLRRQHGHYDVIVMRFPQKGNLNSFWVTLGSKKSAPNINYTWNIRIVAVCITNCF